MQFTLFSFPLAAMICKGQRSQVRCSGRYLLRVAVDKIEE